MNIGGETLNMSNDKEILEIKFPIEKLGGPWIVIAKSESERWAIVAAEWQGEPRLAMRWFWGKLGNPVSHLYPTWLIISVELSNIILNGLLLTPTQRYLIDQFMTKRMSGEDLKREYV